MVKIFWLLAFIWPSKSFRQSGKAFVKRREISEKSICDFVKIWKFELQSCGRRQLISHKSSSWTELRHFKMSSIYNFFKGSEVKKYNNLIFWNVWKSVIAVHWWHSKRVRELEGFQKRYNNSFDFASHHTGISVFYVKSLWR